MVKRIVALFVFASVYFGAFAQWPGMGRVDFKSMPTKILNEEREFAIYLPRDYDKNTNKSYPVLYILHGGGGSHKDWPTRAHLADVANHLITSGEAVEMIIVCPEAGKTFMNYFNSEGWRYEDYFFTELIPFIEKNYRVKADKAHRAIAGLSMGGGGTIGYAIRHSEMFCAAYPMSGYLYHQKELKWLNTSDPVTAKVHKVVDENNCVKLVQNAETTTVDKLKTVKWFIDCGDDDFTFTPNMEFVAALREKQIPYQLRVRDGGHDWEYWHSALYIALPFVSDEFKN